MRVWSMFFPPVIFFLAFMTERPQGKACPLSAETFPCGLRLALSGSVAPTIREELRSLRLPVTQPERAVWPRCVSPQPGHPPARPQDVVAVPAEREVRAHYALPPAAFHRPGPARD